MMATMAAIEMVLHFEWQAVQPLQRGLCETPEGCECESVVLHSEHSLCNFLVISQEVR